MTPLDTIFSTPKCAKEAPSNSSSPPHTGFSPETVCSSVVLPAPLAPTMATISPCLTVRSMPCSTSMRP